MGSCVDFHMPFPSLARPSAICISYASLRSLLQHVSPSLPLPLFQDLFATLDKTLPKYGTYGYSQLADHLGLGTNVVFGEHDRVTLEDKHAEANIY